MAGGFVKFANRESLSRGGDNSHRPSRGGPFFRCMRENGDANRRVRPRKESCDRRRSRSDCVGRLQEQVDVPRGRWRPVETRNTGSWPHRRREGQSWQGRYEQKAAQPGRERFESSSCRVVESRPRERDSWPQVTDPITAGAWLCCVSEVEPDIDRSNRMSPRSSRILGAQTACVRGRAGYWPIQLVLEHLLVTACPCRSLRRERCLLPGLAPSSGNIRKDVASRWGQPGVAAACRRRNSGRTPVTESFGAERNGQY